MITLQKWAERFNPQPHPNTLRNWAKQGNIVPTPVKIGRAYYVEERARHIEEIIHGTASPVA